MQWLNYNTGNMDDLDNFPITIEDLEPYVPKNRRTEFWIRTRTRHPGSDPKVIAADLIREENQKDQYNHSFLPLPVFSSGEIPDLNKEKLVGQE